MTGVRRVVPLTLGFIDLPRYVLVQGDPDEEVRVPVPGVLVECDGGWVLLDTGFNTALINDPALRRRFFGDPAMRPVIPGPGEPLDEALDRAGIDISDIYAVAVSHLHWDHAGGLRYFAGRVPVHVQRTEYQYAMQPGPNPQQNGMFRIDYDDPDIDWRFAFGDTELAPGVTAVSTPGHTPGHQSFVVDLADGGGFVFAFDAVNTTDGCEREMPGLLVDAAIERGAAQIRKLKRIAADRGYPVIPGHDQVAWHALVEHGRAPGREEDVEEGRVQAKREDVLKVLDARHLDLVAEERDRVAQSTSIAELDEWFERALTAATSADVFRDRTEDRATPAPAPLRRLGQWSGGMPGVPRR